MGASAAQPFEQPSIRHCQSCKQCSVQWQHDVLVRKRWHASCERISSGAAFWNNTQKHNFLEDSFEKTPCLLPSLMPSLPWIFTTAPQFAARLPWRQASVYKRANVWGAQHRKAGNLMHSYLSPFGLCCGFSQWGGRSHISKWKSYFYIRSIFHRLSQRFKQSLSSRQPTFLLKYWEENEWKQRE